MTENDSHYFWINGDFVDKKSANISVLTHSLHYSGAVFEGEKAYNGKIFKLSEHTNRLLDSAKSMMLDVPYNFDDIILAHKQLIEKNNISDAYIRPLIWRGAESMNIVNSSLSVNLMIAFVKSSPRSNDNLKLRITTWKKPSSDSFPTQCKSSAHYAMGVVAGIESRNLGYDGALFLDHKGCVAECATSNIFFVHNKFLITPVADTFLNGITRQTIIAIAKNLGIDVIEKHIAPTEIAYYDECFVTGTAVEVNGVHSIYYGIKDKIFEQNEITTILMQEYQKLVRL